MAGILTRGTELDLPGYALETSPPRPTRDVLAERRASRMAELLPPVPETPAEDPGLLSRIGTLGKAAATGAYGAVADVLPKTLAETYRAGDVPLNDTSLAGEVIQENRADMARRQLAPEEANTSVAGLTAQDVKSGMENLGYSGAAILAGMGLGALAGSAIPGAGTTAGAVIGAGTGGAAVGYRATKDQFVQDILDRAKAQDPNLTEEKWGSIRKAVENDAQLYALWEAAPEAVGNMLTAGIIRTPVGRVFKSIPAIKNRIGRYLASAGVKVAGALGEELPTETLTQYKQGEIEARQGLRDQAPTVGEAFREVAPQVGVTTLATLGLGEAGNRLLRRPQDQRSGQPGRETPAPATPGQERQPQVPVTLADPARLRGDESQVFTPEGMGLAAPQGMRPFTLQERTVRAEQMDRESKDALRRGVNADVERTLAERRASRMAELLGVEKPQAAGQGLEYDIPGALRETAQARYLDTAPRGQEHPAPQESEAAARAAQELARARYLEGPPRGEQAAPSEPTGLAVDIDPAEAARRSYLEQPRQPARELQGVEPPVPGMRRDLPVPSTAIPQPAAPGSAFPEAPDTFLAREPSVIPGNPAYTPNLPVPVRRREAMAPEAPYTESNLAQRGKTDLLIVARTLDMDTGFLKQLDRQSIAAHILRVQEEMNRDRQAQGRVPQEPGRPVQDQGAGGEEAPAGRVLQEPAPVAEPAQVGEPGVVDQTGVTLRRDGKPWERRAPADDEARRLTRTTGQAHEAVHVGDGWGVQPATSEKPQEPVFTLGAGNEARNVGKVEQGARQGQEGAIPANGKQPWEMEREEFGKSHKPERIFQRFTPEERADRAASHRMGHRQKEAVGEYFYTTPLVPNRGFDTAAQAKDAAHKASVEQAVSEGKPVPRSVLEEYRGQEWADKALSSEKEPQARGPSQQARRLGAGRLTSPASVTTILPGAADEQARAAQEARPVAGAEEGSPRGGQNVREPSAREVQAARRDILAAALNEFSQDGTVDFDRFALLVERAIEDNRLTFEQAVDFFRESRDVISGMEDSPVTDAEDVFGPIERSKWLADYLLNEGRRKASAAEYQDAAGQLRDVALERYDSIIGRIRQLGGINFDWVRTFHGPGVAEDLQTKLGYDFLSRNGVKPDEIAGELGFTDDQGLADGQALVEYLQDAPNKKQIQERYKANREGRASLAPASTSPRASLSEVQEVSDLLSRAAKNAGPTIAVQSVADMPTGAQREYRRILGQAKPNTRLRALYYQGTTYLVADNITSAADALSGWMHDQAGHDGVRRLFPSDRQFRNVLDLTYRSMTDAQRRAVRERYGIRGDDLDSRLQVADEHLGRLAEKVTLGQALGRDERPTWRRFLDAVREVWARVWRKATGKPLSEQEVAAIVRDAARLVLFGRSSGRAAAIYERATGEPVMGLAADLGRTEGRASLGEGVLRGEFGDRLDLLFSGGMPRFEVLNLGPTPDVLRSLGAERLPLAMTQATARKIHDRHGISVEMMKRLPEQIASPVAVFDSATQPGGLVVLTELRAGGNPVIAAVHLEKVRNEMLVNDVASAYGRNGFAGWIDAQHRAGRWRYVDKKKLPALLRRAGLQLPGKPQNAGSKIPVLTDSDIVKGIGEGRASLADDAQEQPRDEQGRFARFVTMLTKAEDQATKARATENPKSLLATARELRRKNLLESRDLGRMEKVISQPYWLAKRHKEFKPLLDREVRRENELGEARANSWKEVAPAVEKLDSQAREELDRAVWAIEGKKLENVTNAPFKSTGKNEQGRTILALDDEHFTQLRDELERLGFSKPVSAAVVAIRRSLDADLLNVHNRLAEMRDVEDGEIDNYRKNMGRIPNYFPHVRYGDHFIKAVDAKTGDTLYRQHFYAPPGFSSVQAARMLRKVEERFPGAEWSWGKIKGLPEEVWEYPIPVDATEQVIKAAVDRLPNKAGQDKAELKKAMHEATADVFKERGWGRHMIRRQDIPGFETGDVLRILWDHKSGLYGWLTKMDAARDMTGLLWGVDAKAQPQLYAYSAQYVRDMLRNSDSVDRLVSGLKSAMFIKFLGGNLKTAALNLTQNLVAGIPRLSAEGARGTAVQYFKAAMQSAVHQLGGQAGLNQEEKAFLEDLYFRGVTQDQFMREATGQFKGAVAGTLSAIARFLAWPMSMAERFNRVSLGLAAFRMARAGTIRNQATAERFGYKQGQEFSAEDAAKFAEEIVLDAHFLYGKGNRPELFRGSTANRVLASAYTFRTFSHGLLSLWRHLLTSPDMGWRGKRAFAASMAATWTLGGLAATPMYALAMSMIRQLVGDDPENELRKILPGPVAGDAVLYGLPSLVGVSFTGSMGMELPVFERLELDKPVLEQILDQSYEILGVPVAVIQQMGRGFQSIGKGDWGRVMEEMLPTAFANPLQAYRLYTEGSFTRSGRPVGVPGSGKAQKLTAAEAAKKAIGFQPLSRTKSYAMQRSLDELDNYRMREQDDMVSRYLAAKRAGDSAAMSKVFADWREWNRTQQKEGREEFIIEPIPRLAARREKAKQPPKRFRKKAKEMRELSGM